MLYTVARLINILLMALHVVGHVVAGVFFVNTRLLGLAETRYKLLVIAGNLLAWPLAGLLGGLRAGGFSHFGRSLLPVPRPTRGWAWRLLFVFIGARWLAQELYRRRRAKHLPPEVLHTEVERYDMTEEIIGFEGLERSGPAGLLHRANRIYDLELVTHEVRLPHLPQEFDRFTLLQISDVHHMKGLSDEFVRRYVQLAAGLSPDLIAMTGDYQTYHHDVEAVTRLLAPLGAWSCARGGGKVLAILGNHDHEAGATHVKAALRRICVKVLENEHAVIKSGAASLYIAGVSDPWSRRADIERTLHGIPPGSCTILLAHEPDYLVTTARYPVDLQLSGHNHGGQITLPILGPVLVSSRYGRRYAEGFHKLNSTLMYVSRGLGGKPPFRWGARPEITRFILRRSR